MENVWVSIVSWHATVNSWEAEAERYGGQAYPHIQIKVKTRLGYIKYRLKKERRVGSRRKGRGRGGSREKKKRCREKRTKSKEK